MFAISEGWNYYIVRLMFQRPRFIAYGWFNPCRHLQIQSSWLKAVMSLLYTYRTLVMTFNCSTSVPSCLPALWTPVLHSIRGCISIKPNKLWLSKVVLESSPYLAIIWSPLCIIIPVSSCWFYRVSVWVYPCLIFFMKKSDLNFHGFCLACVPNGLSPAL